MKKIIVYIVFAIIFIVDIILTAVLGLNASLYYGEGYTVSFTNESSINTDEIKQIATEIFGNDVLVQNIEFFNDSAKIKVKEVSDDQVKSLCDKINEKYSSKKETSDFKVDHISNIKLSTIVEPYIAPIGISLLIVLTCYAIIFRDIKQMLALVKATLALGIIIFSVHAIARVAVNVYTVPAFVCGYALLVILLTTYFVNKKEISE